MDYNQAKKALYEICKWDGSGDENKVKKILDYHNDTNLINEELDFNGNTVFIFASDYNNIKIIKLLLSHPNININKQDDYGNTALHVASANGYKEIVELLLSHPTIDVNIKDKYGQLASDICCDYIFADKSNKAIILELFKNHSKAKTALTSSTITPSKHSNEGSLSSNHVIPQTTFKESSIVEEVKDKELLTVVEEKESLKLQIEGLEEKMREITNNNMKDMERHLQEKENYMKEMERRLQERECSLRNEMKEVVNNMERRLEEKEKECTTLRDQIVRMEERFEAWMKQMEKRFEEKEKQDSFGRLVTSSPLPLRLPPNKQTHVFLTHTWREDEKGRNNHDRVKQANRSLQKRGLVTWFDEEWMSGTPRDEMTDALNATCCVLIFITKKYEEKVNSKNEGDNCYFEFNAAAHNTLVNMRIPIVMEECMLNQEGWQGRLKTEMGHRMSFDLSSDDDKEFLEKQYGKIVERVVELLTERYPEIYFENNLKSSSAPSVAKRLGNIN